MKNLFKQSRINKESYCWKNWKIYNFVKSNNAFINNDSKKTSQRKQKNIENNEIKNKLLKRLINLKPMSLIKKNHELDQRVKSVMNKGILGQFYRNKKD